MWRNSPAGYGALTKLLHWATVVALAAQFVLGYLLDVDDDSGRGRGRGRGRGEGSGHGRGRGGDDEGGGAFGDDFDVFGDDRLLQAHVALGLLILTLAVLRVVWRRVGALPPWAESLSPAERRVAHVTERVLLAMLFVIPLSGLALVISGDDDLVWLHVTAHVVFFVALAVHLGQVLKQQVTGGRLLQRML